MKLVDLKNIQKNRAAFMGLAMLWVIVFHYSFLKDTPLYYITERGYLGVDIFILLSSFGLCFSLKKNDNYKDFITKRIKRIIPTWWLLITAMLVVNIVLQRDYPHSFFQMICYYSGLGWWVFHNEPFGIYYYEWYIPTLLAFYLFMPFVYKLNNKRIAALFTATIIAAMVLDNYCIMQRLSLSYQRIPAFIYGVILYRMFSGQIDERFSNRYLCISSILGLIIFTYAMICKKNGGIDVYSFMFAMPLLLSLCSVALLGKFNKTLSFVGTLTLELYLLHIYNLPLYAVMKFVGHRGASILVTIIVLTGIAFIVNRTVNFVARKLYGK